jgi:hypothetical protein
MSEYGPSLAEDDPGGRQQTDGRVESGSHLTTKSASVKKKIGKIQENLRMTNE